MGKEEIKIIKKEDRKKFEDYAFIDNNIELKKIDNENVSNLSPSVSSSFSSSSSDEKYKEYVSKLRNNPKKDRKAHEKSRLAGGHSTQSRSPIYE
jgi:hypothetical protein